jgi:dipeptidyl aminopeptidase/acylaminoacyl peptidase
MPCVLYLHENCGSRVQGLNLKLYLLKRNINICAFDFAGSGQSEGKYISLGYHEKHQVKNVVDFLERLPGVGNIGIWGRSMGAATTLLYTPTDKRIKCIVVDSPFSNFRKLAKEICLHEVKVPGLLIEGAISIIGTTVYNKNGMDINDIKAIDTVKNCYVPAFFIHAEDDTFVKYKHSEKLFQNYAGNLKKLKGITGGHNGARSRQLLAEVGEFFADYLIPGHLDSKLNKTIKINNPNDNEGNQKAENNNEINDKDKK